MQVLYKTSISDLESAQQRLNQIQTGHQEVQELTKYTVDKLNAAEGVYTTSGVVVGAPIDVLGAQNALAELERDYIELQRLSAEAASAVYT